MNHPQHKTPPEKLAKQREYYKNHKAYYAEKHKEYRKKNLPIIRGRNKKYQESRHELIRQLKNKPCADCGVQYSYYVMEFDHLPQFEKSFNVAHGIWYSLETILEEATKCEVVCSNCHRERTHKRKIEGGYDN